MIMRAPSAGEGRSTTEEALCPRKEGGCLVRVRVRARVGVGVRDRVGARLRVCPRKV